MEEQSNNQLQTTNNHFSYDSDQLALLQQKNQELESRLDSMSKNTKYLEDKLAQTLTQKEEQIIKLKSEIVIYKHKISNYKAKLKEAINGFETQKIQEYQREKDEEVNAKQAIIEELKCQITQLQEEKASMDEKNQALEQRITELETKYQSQIHEQDAIITQLSRRLKEIDKDYSQQLLKVDNIRENTQKRLNIEEKERTLNSIKLEYLVNNYRKLQLQKKFLVKTIDKNLANLAQEMKKSEMEMQKDVYVTSQSANATLNGMYSIIKDSLRYVKDVIGFMNFDVDQVQGESEPNQSESIIKHSHHDDQDPIEKYENLRGQSQNKQDLHTAQPIKETESKQFTIEACFYKHIYELTEVLLSVLSEIYKESRTQTSIENVQLFNLLQSRTNKSIVEQIYKQFFAQNRIHFAQFMNKLSVKNFDLQQERNDLKLQVQSLTSQIQEMIAEQERLHEEQQLKEKQEQRQLQELVEEEIKEQELHESQNLFSNQRNSLNLDRNQPAMVQLSRYQTMVNQSLQNQLNRDDSSNHHSQSDITQKDHPGMLQTKQSSFNLKDFFMNISQGSQNGRTSPAAVASVILKSQEKRIVEILQIENMALKERIRETRLTFQRQINELQDEFQSQKEKQQSELNRIKIEYGRDLTLLHKTQKERELEIVEAFEKEKTQEIRKLNEESEKKLQEIQMEFDLKFEDIKEKLETAEQERRELERELRKLKKLSNNIAQGGWGTFSIVFEDAHKKHYPFNQHQSLIASYGMTSQTPKSSMESTRDRIPKKLIRQSSSEFNYGRNDTVDSIQDIDFHKEEIPQEKLQHFIEVGFLMDAKNFKYLNNYREKSFESILTKYLFEFQDPIDNFKMMHLQNKIKQQLIENFALFNEINPVYVSLNLGRSVSPFSSDGSISQENFKLIKRESFSVSNDHYLMVNFLKCEKPSFIIRIIAFDNEKCIQHCLDLTLEDLMILVDGNMKLLEDDHLNDLCQIILNNLTMQKREVKVKRQKEGLKRRKAVKNDEDTMDESQSTKNTTNIVLIDKFSAKERLNYDSEIQNILAVEHKLFFNEHYRNEYDQRNRVILVKHDKKKKGLISEKSIATDFDTSVIYEAFDIVYEESEDQKDQELQLFKNYKLQLFRGRMSKNIILKITFIEANICQELTLFSTKVSKNNQSHQVTSEIVKLPNDAPNEQPLTYLVSLEKLYGLDNHYVIRIVSIQSMQNPVNIPQNNNLNQTIYLVQKSNKQFMRVNEYEILNTEMRSLLFMHSYGYSLALQDFGQLKAIEGVNINTPIEQEMLQTMTLLFRDFGIIRIKKPITTSDDDNEQPVDIEEDDGDVEEQDDEEFVYENSAVSYAFYDDKGSISQGEVMVFLKIYGLNIELKEYLSISQVLNDNEIEKLTQHPEEYCRKVFDKMIVLAQNEKYTIVVEKDSQAMSEIIEQIKQAKMQEQLDEQALIKPEYNSDQIQLTLNQLAECSKITQVTILNRKLLKINAYFVNNLKNLQTLTLQNKRIYDWQLIFINAQHRQQVKQYDIIITEKDLHSICDKFQASLNPSDELLQTFNNMNILSTQTKQEQLIDFILDCLVLNDNKSSLQLSLNHLRTRLEDRMKLCQQFRLNGAKFINKLGMIEDPDYNQYKSSLVKIELSRKLITNVEKEFADKKYDIKIYELGLKNNRGCRKYQFEMFCIDHPQAIFRVDYYSEGLSQGMKLMIERFNIIQQLHEDYEENKFIRDGMVLCIAEQSFPHKIVFMVLEPQSLIQWQYTVQDDKLNQIESRVEKEAFVQMIKEKLEQEMLGQPRLNENVQFIQNLGYQKNQRDNGQVELWYGNLKSVFNNQDRLIYGRNIDIIQVSDQQNELNAEILILSNPSFNSIRLQLSVRSETYEIDINLDSQRESLRFITGFFNLQNQKMKLIYTIEIACAYTQQERAIRITLEEPLLNQKLINVILCDKHLLNVKQQSNGQKDVTIKNELKYAFSTGYKDSFTLFQKLPNLVTDYKKAFIEKGQQVEICREIDTSKLVYRKVVTYDDSTLILFLKYDSIEKAETEWKVVLFDQSNDQEDSFIFKTENILTKDELNSLNAKNDRIMRDVVKRVVDQRMKIKLIDEDKNSLVSINANSGSNNRKRYMVYFSDPPLGVVNDTKDKYRHNFDIRNGYGFSFTDPDSLKPELIPSQTSQERQQTLKLTLRRLITQLEKDDLIFDVYEILSPYELILRIKTYECLTLKLISVSDVKEFEIRKELIKDQMSYLIEPHRRIDLAKYLVQNLYYDELRKRVFFLQSQQQNIASNDNMVANS